MRLLERSDAGEFGLTEYFVNDDEIPPYAILSHTWVAGEEVVYEELKNGAGKGKSGYHKIRFCGEQARRDGLQYFWVDTCCLIKEQLMPGEVSDRRKICVIYGLGDIGKTQLAIEYARLHACPRLVGQHAQAVFSP